MTQLKLISMDQVPIEEVQWLWYPYIPYGKLTIIHGDPGEGKTTLILRLAALLSQGESLPCDDRPQEPVKIIYQTAEDGLGDTIKPRLLAGDADCAQIKVIDETEASLTLLDERVEQAISETGARVMILDPVQAYVGTGVDMNRANEVRTVLAQLSRIAEKYKCAMILVGHLNKAQGTKSQYRGLGSIDFQAAARSVLIVGRVKEKPEVRVMAHEKSSLAPEGEPVAFELSADNGFRWLGHYDINTSRASGSGTPICKSTGRDKEALVEFYIAIGKRFDAPALYREAAKLLRKYGMYEEELSVINAGLLNIPKNNSHRDELFERKKKVQELIKKEKEAYQEVEI